jgi:hypothetical protein
LPLLVAIKLLGDSINVAKKNKKLFIFISGRSEVQLLAGRPARMAKQLWWPGG